MTHRCPQQLQLLAEKDRSQPAGSPTQGKAELPVPFSVSTKASLRSAAKGTLAPSLLQVDKWLSNFLKNRKFLQRESSEILTSSHPGGTTYTRDFGVFQRW